VSLSRRKPDDGVSGRRPGSGPEQRNRPREREGVERAGPNAPRHEGGRQPFPSKLQPRIDWFALQRKHSEDTLMNSAQWFLVNEPLQRFQSQSKLPKSERPLCAQTSAL
jgi:hypothetical protein